MAKDWDWRTDTGKNREVGEGLAQNDHCWGDHCGKGRKKKEEGEEMVMKKSQCC